ncbi:hypothetical protein CEUSTIGMA_g12979.t1 [Chlamydomonas eustigma]|uniref:triose-phosphate isomerase n=1 Tax=Chlamydomonas eustigma TaxID=1157962 RepID=A0A250XR83_9CHLO|nr:hypothetical protein CEUSTIGMA_g12979.t1 [Chlamydomonas eustigma]|eukprot:GAX85564.1 hypothetical protein CEUSTIGMA_g12979.t1 [Chlamydomonas eustigma]
MMPNILKTRVCSNDAASSASRSWPAVISMHQVKFGGSMLSSRTGVIENRRSKLERMQTIALVTNEQHAATLYISLPEAFIEKKKTLVKLSSKQQGTDQKRAARQRKVLMAGNWKMNPASIKEAREMAALLASSLRTIAQDKPGFDVEVVVIPPSPFLHIVADVLSGTVAKIGAQDVHPESKGAFTGEVSTGMLMSMGVSYVLAGHSERRNLFNESDAVVNKKVKAVLASGLSPILCIGESKEEYESGLVKDVCSKQLREGLVGVSAEDLQEKLVIAYEPVWAIGTGLTATPAIAQSVHSYIRSVIKEMYSPEVANAVRIQYGGSVTPESVDELMTCPDIDGCLVGGASLVAEKFSRIFSYQAPPPGSPEKLYASEVVPCGCTLGESVVWSEAMQSLFWVDSVGQALWSWRPSEGTGTSKPIRWKLPEVVGCVALQESGDLLLGLQSGIFNFDLTAGVARKLTDFERPLDTRPNDGRVDRFGSFVVGSYNNAHRQDGAEIGGLWRLNPDGNMQEILDYKFRCSNCVCFSPDGLTMYFTDTPTRRIFAFDYNPAGKLSNRRLVYELPSSISGGPDGAQTDAQGHLWVCLSGASRVVRLEPLTGAVEAVVELPVTSPTCCTFGGPDLDTLYITTRGPDGGGLYCVKMPPGIRGIAEPMFAWSAVQHGSSCAAPEGKIGPARWSRASDNQGESWMSASSRISQGMDEVKLPRRVTSTNGLLSISSDYQTKPAWLTSGNSSQASRFCADCGHAHTTLTAKFCTECGAPRITLYGQ